MQMRRKTWRRPRRRPTGYCKARTTAIEFIGFKPPAERATQPNSAFGLADLRGPPAAPSVVTWYGSILDSMPWCGSDVGIFSTGRVFKKFKVGVGS
jgi:hypothetical protein